MKCKQRCLLTDIDNLEENATHFSTIINNRKYTFTYMEFVILTPDRSLLWSFTTACIEHILKQD